MDFDNLLLAIQVQLNLHIGSRNRSHENLSNTSKNLNFLGDSLKIPSHDSNRDFFSDVSKEKVEAVVHFIVVRLVIKGADVGRCNITSSRNLGKSIESNIQEGGSQREGENTLLEGAQSSSALRAGDTNVPQLVSSSIVFHDKLSQIANTVYLGDDFYISRRDMIDGSLNQVTKEPSAVHKVSNIGNNKVKNGQSVQESGNNHFSADLINGSSLVTNQFTNLSQRMLKLLFLSTTQKFRGVADRLLLLFSLDHKSLHFDNFFSLVHTSKFNLSIKNDFQSLLEQLFLIP